MARKWTVVSGLLLSVAGCGGSEPVAQQASAQKDSKPDGPVEASQSASVAELTDEAVMAFVRQALGERLLTNSPQTASGPPGMMPPIPGPPPFLAEPALASGFSDPADAYVQQLDTPLEFSSTAPRPRLEVGRDDCPIKAEVTNIAIKKRIPKGANIVELQWEATQRQLQDLYKLASAKDLRKAIAWDEGRLDDARKLARSLPPHKQSALRKQWNDAHESRAWVMELAHATGTEWNIHGTVRAKRSGRDWGLEHTRIRPDKPPSSSVITREHFPKGLLAFNPADHAGIAGDWSKPYEEFITAVRTTADQVAIERKGQSDRLAELLKPSCVWKARIAGSKQAADFTLHIDELRDGKFYQVRFIARRDDGEINEIPVFGFASEMNRASDLPEPRPELPSELLGPVILMQPATPSDWPAPWNQLEFRLALRPGDPSPTLIWLNQVLPMEKSKAGK